MDIKKYTLGSPFITDAVTVNIESENTLPSFISTDGEKIILTLPLDREDIIYGLGEQVGGINKRGRVFRSFCTDESLHSEDREALYGAHNFIIVSGKTCTGYFIDFPSLIRWDLGFSEIDKAVISIEGTAADIYVINGKNEIQITEDFRKIIGKSYMPPMWAFGYQQCRWSYPNAETVEKVAEGYEKSDIPLDTIYLDIDYMQKFKDFTINEEAFPDFENFTAKMRKRGIRLIPIIDAGIRCERGFDVYDEGVKGNYFCKDKDGNDFHAAVWPGICCFPDYLKPEARKWFGEKFKLLTDKGIEGFWIDMNEPAIFYTPERLKSVADSVREYDGSELDCWEFFGFREKFAKLANNDDDYKNMYHLDGKVSHYDVHNLYGYMMTRGVSEALPKDTLLFSRASYIGSHRYGGIWTGDNTSWWSHILLNLRMLPSLNMCGYIYMGADCGGFNGNAGRSLVLRWMQLSVFTPLFRNHTSIFSRNQEAYAYENPEDFKAVIEVRYRLIPYLYHLAKDCAENGKMMFKPLGFEFSDTLSKECDDQLLLGDELMIAPIYEENKNHRTVYLPEEMTFIKLSGNTVTHKEKMQAGIHCIEVQLSEVPLFVRKGKALPLCAPAKNTDSLNAEITDTIIG